MDFAELPLTVKYLRRSKSLRLRVLPTGQIQITAPPFTSAATIRRFLSDNEAWLAERKAAVDHRLQSLTATRDRLLFMGREYDFRLSVAAIKPGVAISDKTLTVTAPAEDNAVVRPILEKWYTKQAQKYFKERVPLLTDVVGHRISRVSIRSQRTRWGSCSSRGTISLNWRLILAPPFVSEYVIYHELAHLTHMNHSKAFWRLVEDYFPRYQEAEKWLKTHHELLQF